MKQIDYYKQTFPPITAAIEIINGRGITIFVSHEGAISILNYHSQIVRLLAIGICILSIQKSGFCADLEPTPLPNLHRDRTATAAVVPTGSDVTVSSGTYHFTETDLRVSARSIPMEWDRNYSSNRVVKDSLGKWSFGQPVDGLLGYGWTNLWLSRIEGNAYVNSEGRYFYFDKDANGAFVPNMKAGYTLLKTATGYEMREQSGKTYLFNGGGRLTSIKDSRGKSDQLIYNAQDQLTSIQDVMGRTIYTIAYTTTGKIGTVIDLAGRTITYEYDPDGNLQTVKSNSQVIATYHYNNQHVLTSKSNAMDETYAISYCSTWEKKGIVSTVTDPAGRIATFRYDFKLYEFYYQEYNGNVYRKRLNRDGDVIMIEEVDATVFTDQVNTQTQLPPPPAYIAYTNGVVTASSVPQTAPPALVAVAPCSPGKGATNVPGVLISHTDYPDKKTTTTTDALGNITTIQKDDWNNITKKVDEAGNEWKNTYDTQSRLQTATDPLGTIAKYEYDQYNNKAKEIQAAGTTDESITTYAYNEYNELSSITKDDATTTYEYGLSGNVTKITDPLGNSTTMTYDGAGNLLTRTQPLIGATTYSNYDYKGNPGTITDPNGNITLYTYDALGRIKTITTQSDNATTEYFYVTTGGTSCPSCGSSSTQGNGKISAIVLPEGNRISYAYDTAGNLSKITDNDGNTINYTYDKHGNKTKEEIDDSNGVLQKVVGYQYDLLNRQTRIINPDTAYTETKYDARGNRISVKNPNLNTTSYEYDQINRLKKVIQPGNVTTAYSYDRRSNLTSVTDANGNTTYYEYDKRDHVTKTVSPDTGTTTYAYDLNGNLSLKTDATGTAINYQYDAVNRMTKVDFATDTDTVYSYDTCVNGKGRLCTMTDASGMMTYQYTTKGHVKKVMNVIDNVTHVMQYSYDSNGNIKTMSYPSGRVITYNYSNDRITSVLNNIENLATNINYKPFGGVSSLKYGNDLMGTIDYDNQYRVASISTGTIMNLTYADDANGNITASTNILELTLNKSFTYDILDRLSSAVAPGIWGSLGWTYDGVGNRMTEGVNSYAYVNNTNKLAIANGLSYSYDNNGNTTAEGAHQYMYNQNQRLIRVIDAGVTKGEYTYNGSGQRVKKTVNGVTTFFHYSINGQLLAESDSAGIIAAEYVYLNGNPLAKIETNSVYFYHNDSFATPQKMTDRSDKVVWSADYNPFGETTITVSMITNNLRFPGQYFDAETGLHQNGFRDYNVNGRYIEADRIGLLGGANLFIYGDNNPINSVDPYGFAATLYYNRNTGILTGGNSAGNTITITVTDNGISITPGDPYGKKGPVAPGLYNINPRPSDLDRPGYPTLSSPGQDWNTIVSPDGTIRSGVQIHPGKKSEGCLLTKKKTSDYDTLINFINPEYDNGGVKLIIVDR